MPESTNPPTIYHLILQQAEDHVGLPQFQLVDGSLQPISPPPAGVSSPTYNKQSRIVVDLPMPARELVFMSPLAHDAQVDPAPPVGQADPLAFLCKGTNFNLKVKSFKN